MWTCREENEKVAETLSVTISYPRVRFDDGFSNAIANEIFETNGAARSIFVHYCFHHVACRESANATDYGFGACCGPCPYPCPSRDRDRDREAYPDHHHLSHSHTHPASDSVPPVSSGPRRSRANRRLRRLPRWLRPHEAAKCWSWSRSVATAPVERSRRRTSGWKQSAESADWTGRAESLVQPRPQRNLLQTALGSTWGSAERAPEKADGARARRDASTAAAFRAGPLGRARCDRRGTGRAAENVDRDNACWAESAPDPAEEIARAIVAAAAAAAAHVPYFSPYHPISPSAARTMGVGAHPVACRASSRDRDRDPRRPSRPVQSWQMRSRVAALLAEAQRSASPRRSAALFAAPPRDRAVPTRVRPRLAFPDALSPRAASGSRLKRSRGPQSGLEGTAGRAFRHKPDQSPGHRGSPLHWCYRSKRS